MPDWTTFAIATAILTLLLLGLTHRSQQMLEEVTILDEPPASAERPTPESVGHSPESVGHSPESVGYSPESAAPSPESAAPSSEDVASEENAGDRDHGEDASDRDHGEDAGDRDDGVDDNPDADVRDGEAGDVPEVPRTNRSAPPGEQYLTTRLLLANAAVSQGVGLAALIGLAWWTGVPAAAFGLAAEVAGPAHVALGLLAGVILYAGNEVAAGLGERFGFSAPERLREAMAPTDRAEWAFLLLVVLPVIAVFEELLFRGALIGALSVGLALDPWLLAVVSSAVFGLGHGAQGRIGIAVTALLGFVLAALFVVSGSLLLVIVAHYVINALEFAVREGLGWSAFGR